MVTLYDQSTVWQQDEDQGYEFDLENGRVFFRKQTVDMIQICDNCLSDVNRAAVSSTRNQEIYHKIGDQKKADLEEMRRKESKRAQLLVKLAIERARRRAREFSLRALSSYQHGKTQEERMERMEKEREASLQEEARRKGEKYRLIHESIRTDTKWRLQDAASTQKTFHQLYDKADTQYIMPFSRANPVPKEREHPYSWKLAPFNVQGLPVDPKAAAEVIVHLVHFHFSLIYCPLSMCEPDHMQSRFL